MGVALWAKFTLPILPGTLATGANDECCLHRGSLGHGHFVSVRGVQEQFGGAGADKSTALFDCV